MKIIVSGSIGTNEGYSEGVKSKWVKQASGQSGDRIVCVGACV